MASATTSPPAARRSGAAGNAVVTAAYYSIHPAFVAASLDLCREHATFAAAAAARDAAVVTGLRQYVPEICDELAAMAEPLWAAADALPPGGRPLYAAHQEWSRPEDPLLSAWLAVNCIREWRGDTHWAIHVAEDIDGVTAGVLDGRGGPMRGSGWPAAGRDDDSIAEALAELERRGLATDGAVNADGIAYRQGLEDRLDRICVAAWQHPGRGAHPPVPRAGRARRPHPHGPGRRDRRPQLDARRPGPSRLTGPGRHRSVASAWRQSGAEGQGDDATSATGLSGDGDRHGDAGCLGVQRRGGRCIERWGAGRRPGGERERRDHHHR